MDGWMEGGLIHVDGGMDGGMDGGWIDRWRNG